MMSGLDADGPLIVHTLADTLGKVKTGVLLLLLGQKDYVTLFILLQT